MRGWHPCLSSNQGILLIPSRPIKIEIHYSTGSSCFSFKEKKRKKNLENEFFETLESKSNSIHSSVNNYSKSKSTTFRIT